MLQHRATQGTGQHRGQHRGRFYVLIGNTGDGSMCCSRKDTELMTSSTSFGKGRNDDIYTALLYAYTDSELQSKYGSQFEIIPENVICYSSEGSSFFFSSFYKGEADYGFEFKEGIYRIKLSKSYNNKWKVNSVEWVVHELKEE